MIKIFRRWTRVKEVFISRRLNKWGRRFGFVRFFEVRNVGRLERDLNQIYIGKKKLHVNVPRYKRNEMESKRQEKETRSIYTEKVRKPNKMKEITLVLHENKRTKEVWRAKTGKKTFAEVVKGDTQRKWKGPIIKTEQQVLPWMEYSAIGQFREEMDFEQLGEEFVKGGMNSVRVRYMRDNLVLLTPHEGENMEELINLNKEWFESVFQNIEPWSPELVAGHKIVWVRCYGLLLSLWNKDCFSKVVGEVTTLVSIMNP